MLGATLSVWLLLQEPAPAPAKLLEAVKHAAGVDPKTEVRVVLVASSENADLVCGCHTTRRGWVSRFLRRVF